MYTTFFAEALALCVALHWASTVVPKHSKLAIYTDNTNTVAVFNSLKANPPYNSLLQWAVDLLIETEIDLRVFHISGEINVVTDALSLLQFPFLSSHHPDLDIFFYELPASLRGALPK